MQKGFSYFLLNSDHGHVHDFRIYYQSSQNQLMNLSFVQKPDSNPYVFDALFRTLLQAFSLPNMNASCYFYVELYFVFHYDSTNPKFCFFNFSCCLSFLLSSL